LRKFIHFASSKKSTHLGDSRVARGCDFQSLFVRSTNHAPKFDDLERFAVLADAPLPEEDWTSRFQSHRKCAKEEKRSCDHQRRGGSGGVKYPLAKTHVEPTSRPQVFWAYAALGFSRAGGWQAACAATLRAAPVKLWNSAHGL